MTPATSMTPVVRTSHGLVDALFDSIDRLNGKKITPEEARAVSHTARSIVSIAHLELKARQLEGGASQIHSLMIDATPGDAPQPKA
jgi:hypothetical protein